MSALRLFSVAALLDSMISDQCRDGEDSKDMGGGGEVKRLSNQLSDLEEIV